MGVAVTATEIVCGLVNVALAIWNIRNARANHRIAQQNAIARRVVRRP